MERFGQPVACLGGLSYAALLWITLSFAAINPAKTGTRIGLVTAEQIGPL